MSNGIIGSLTIPMRVIHGYEQEIQLLREQLADALCAEDRTQKELADCRISLQVYDVGKTSEYWLRYEHADPSEVKGPGDEEGTRDLLP